MCSVFSLAAAPSQPFARIALLSIEFTLFQSVPCTKCGTHLFTSRHSIIKVVFHCIRARLGRAKKNHIETIEYISFCLLWDWDGDSDRFLAAFGGKRVRLTYVRRFVAKIFVTFGQNDELRIVRSTPFFLELIRPDVCLCAHLVRFLFSFPFQLHSCIYSGRHKSSGHICSLTPVLSIFSQFFFAFFHVSLLVVRAGQRLCFISPSSGRF